VGLLSGSLLLHICNPAFWPLSRCITNSYVDTGIQQPDVADVINDLASYLGDLPALYIQAFFHESVELLPLLGSYWANRRGSNPNDLWLFRLDRSPTPLLSALFGALFFALLPGLPTILFLGHC
jgi:hypothetical protein